MVVNFLLIVSFVAPLTIMTYPLISYIRFKYFSKPIAKSSSFVVPISIIIACYNEERYIRNKILSFLDKDEWIEDSEIIIVSAGSTDNTNTILQEFMDIPSIQIIISQIQLSKIMAVNMAVEYAKNQILVFSDCRQTMKCGSIKQMINNFNDDKIGTVVSILKDSYDDKKQSIFRRIINRIVYYDSQSGSGLNVYGALYAQRKLIFCKFPQDQLFDDLCVITNTLSKKKRLIQEPNAVIYDVNFQSYYGGERIERLARGLLIFITKQWRQLMKISKMDFLRFLIFKYAKLFLPFSFLIWLIWFAHFAILNILHPAIYSILIIFLILITIRQSRMLLFFAFRINIYFFWAIFKFIFLNKQSVRWNKLNIKNYSAPNK